MGIVVIGAAFVDIKGFPNDAFIADGRNAGRVEYVHGGVARNVVENIANIELKPTYLGIVDDTPLGQGVLDKLKKHKVNTDYVMVRPDGMGTWLAIFDNDGDVAGSISKRPDMMPLVDLLEEKGDEIFSQADAIVLEVDLDKPIVKKVIELGHKYHKPLHALVSNMTICCERRDLIKEFDCFICNQQEAGMYFSRDCDNMDCDEMQRTLPILVKNAGLKTMIVTMGEKGAIYATADNECGYVKAHQVQVKDTTGAGDAFCAGVAIGMTYGKKLPETVNIGSTLAASVITSHENVCPRFLPAELGLDIEVKDE